MKKLIVSDPLANDQKLCVAHNINNLVSCQNGIPTIGDGSPTTDPEISYSPWGQCISLGSTSKEIRYPGAGHTSAPTRITLYSTFKCNEVSRNCAIVATNYQTTSDTSIGGISLEIVSNAMAIGVAWVTTRTTSTTLTNGKWYSSVVEILSTGAFHFYLCNHTDKTFSEEIFAASFTSRAGNNVACVNLRTSASQYFNGDILVAGYTTRSWGLNEAKRYFDDPLRFVRFIPRTFQQFGPLSSAAARSFAGGVGVSNQVPNSYVF